MSIKNQREMTNKEAAAVLIKLLNFHYLEDEWREAFGTALTALSEQKTEAHSLSKMLLQMVNNDSKAAAKWAHEWADKIDRLNESMATLPDIDA
jgi:hypothetical protein